MLSNLTPIVLCTQWDLKLETYRWISQSATQASAPILIICSTVLPVWNITESERGIARENPFESENCYSSISEAKESKRIN